MSLKCETKERVVCKVITSIAEETLEAVGDIIVVCSQMQWFQGDGERDTKGACCASGSLSGARNDLGEKLGP